MKNEFLKIANQKEIHNVPFSDIIHVESDGMSTVTYTASGAQHRCSKNLGAILKELKHESAFVRVHTSYVVNLTKIKLYRKENGGVIVMVNGSQIPVSKRRKSDFMRKYCG